MGTVNTVNAGIGDYVVLTRHYLKDVLEKVSSDTGDHIIVEGNRYRRSDGAHADGRLLSVRDATRDEMLDAKEAEERYMLISFLNRVGWYNLSTVALRIIRAEVDAEIG